MTREVRTPAFNAKPSNRDKVAKPRGELDLSERLRLIEQVALSKLTPTNDHLDDGLDAEREATERSQAMVSRRVAPAHVPKRGRW